MQELQRNSLLQNVNLTFEDSSDDLLFAFLTTILPLITSIDWIKFFGLVLYKNAYSEFGKSMLKLTQVIESW
jgi:hypothetical protein